MFDLCDFEFYLLLCASHAHASVRFADMLAEVKSLINTYREFCPQMTGRGIQRVHLAFGRYDMADKYTNKQVRVPSVSDPRAFVASLGFRSHGVQGLKPKPW